MRVIVTVDPHSNTMANLRDQGCDIIKISPEPTIIQNQIANHLSKQLFIVTTRFFTCKLNCFWQKDDEAYKQKVLATLENNPAKNQSLFVKVFLSTLLPYPADKIISLQDIDLEEFKKLYTDLDFERLQCKFN